MNQQSLAPAPVLAFRCLVFSGFSIFSGYTPTKPSKEGFVTGSSTAAHIKQGSDAERHPAAHLQILLV